MRDRHFVIAEMSKDGKLVKSSLWDASEPIGLGHPFQYILEKTETGIRFRDLRRKTTREITGEVLEEGSLRLHIHPARQKDLELAWTSTVVPSHTAVQLKQEGNETRIFKRSFLTASACLLVLLALTFVMPKPSEELIPAQYAKIIMTPSFSKNEGKAQAKLDEQKIVRSGNVVNALKTEVVQKSTQKLLKGGILAALAKSNLLADRHIPVSVKSLFGGGIAGTKLAALSPLGGNLQNIPQNTMIGVLGGKKGEGGSTGYSAGEQLSVQGQGRSFVKLENMDSVVEEGLSKDEVGQVIHSHIAEIRYCYESAMIRKPDIQGKLILDFVIQGKGFPGSVKSADINSSTLEDYSFDQCIVSRLLKWKFPKPKGRVDVAVSYPFIFKSLGK